MNLTIKNKDMELDAKKEENVALSSGVNQRDEEIQLMKEKLVSVEKDLEVSQKELQTVCERCEGLKIGTASEQVRCEQEKVSVLEKDVDSLETKYSELKEKFVTQERKVAETLRELREFAHETGHQLKDLQIQEANRTTDEKYKELVGKYTHEIQLRKQYHNQLVELKGNIRVYCRVRPCLPENGPTEPVVSFDHFDDGVIMVNSKGKCQKFHMDKVFNMNISQSEVFDEVSALVHSAIDGFNVCIFAYGQTGSGKTHTMEGVSHDPGVNQRALQLLYEETKTSGLQYSIETSMLEIYNESLRDLLNPDPNTSKLEVKMKQEGGFHVPGLVTMPVNSLSEVNKIIETGRQNRATASTSMNETSSRSHSLLCVCVTGTNVLTGNKTVGRLNLVDLAGSERVSRSQAEGARLKEAQNINKSLSSLGDVINALKNKHAHVPYQNSKLTYLLQESLGGDSKTLMILQVSPREENVSESICTLTFGQRVRSVELGPAKKKTEATPTATRPTESANSIMSGTPLLKTPNRTKASPMPVKLVQSLKQ